MNIGYKLYKKDKIDNNYADMAVWCNNNNAHIEDKGEYYEIVVNQIEPIPEPTLEEQIGRLERQTGYTRAFRELILAPNSGASDYVRTKAQEIEDLAEQLRQ